MRARIWVLIQDDPGQILSTSGYEAGELSIVLVNKDEGGYRIQVYSPEGSKLRPIPGNDCNLRIENISPELTAIEFDMERLE